MTNKAAETKQQERGEEGTQPGPISCQNLAAKERSGPTSCQNRAAKESRSRAHQVQPRRIRKRVNLAHRAHPWRRRKGAKPSPTPGKNLAVKPSPRPMG